MNEKPFTKPSYIPPDHYDLWEMFLMYDDESSQEAFWSNYEAAVAASQKRRKHQMMSVASDDTRISLEPQMIALPQLFTIEPNQRTPFLKKLWAYQVWPIAKAFSVAWIAMSIFFSIINKDGNSYQLLSISAMLLLFFIGGIAYHYWVVCRPLADMQLIIDRLGIMREGAGLDHLSIKYSEIVDIRKGPIGLQICLKPRGRIQEDRESILLPGALHNYTLVCELLEHHLAYNDQYYSLTS